MKIKEVTIKNFRSIEDITVPFGSFNALVGQNNSGKTNFFEALKWFWGGFERQVTKEDIVFSEARRDAHISVEITFSGLQSAIANMKNETKKKALENIFGNGTDEIKIRRTTEFNDVKTKQLLNPQNNDWENTLGADRTWNELLPRLEYVHTKVSLEEVGNYKSKSPIVEMLSDVLASIIENDRKYSELEQKFRELFGDKKSRVRGELDKLGQQVSDYLRKQFSGDPSVKFNVDNPEFNDLLKNISIAVDDGVVTLAEDKGDGMQRAVMLSIIQVYADFRKRHNIANEFVFLIDEAELHLHPSAQRALKKALMEISEGNDQVFVNTHSYVIITDDNIAQKIFKVEKRNKLTEIEPIKSDDQKMDVIFELLGGSPADLLLPKNFIIVEGQSEYEFLRIIKQRFYPGIYDEIKIIFARGDMYRTRETFNAIHEAYKPLFVDGGIYKEKVVILCDAPNNQNQKYYDDFMRSHNWVKEGEQMHKLPFDALEKYYPKGYKKNDAGIKALEKGMGKVGYAKQVAEKITQSQFEGEMGIIFNALQKAKEKAF